MDESSASSSGIREAVILAAGNGDRFRNGTRQSKLLHGVLGQPLILRTLATAAAAGISRFEVIVGYQADAIRRVVERGLPPDTRVHFTYNPEWRMENGVSALCARERMADRRFALLMGDHLFEPRVLAMLLQFPAGRDESVLAVDTRPAPPAVAGEATQVRMRGSYVTAIGKGLGAHDALDTGLFVCAPALFEALAAARAAGDTTLSGGIRALAARGLMRAADIAPGRWHDIDTMADLTTAETILAAQAQPEPA